MSGLTLNMSMLRYFFEIGTDPSLFDGLYIAEKKELCEEYMGKYPVVSISLKGVNAENFADACSFFDQDHQCRSQTLTISGRQ